MTVTSIPNPNARIIFMRESLQCILQPFFPRRKCTYDEGMSKLGALLLLTCGALLLACGGDGKGNSPDNSPCSGPVGRCEPLPLTTSRINLASGSAPIAAIETSGCAVSWSVHLWSDSFPNVASTACVAGATSDGSSNCVRYPCSPADGGISCAEALVQIYTTHCSVTVIATTGETQTFDITLSPGTYRIFCRTSDGTCVENSPQIVTPPQVTLAFSLLDSGVDRPSQ